MTEYLVVSEEGYSFVEYLDEEEVNEYRLEGYQLLPVEQTLVGLGWELLPTIEPYSLQISGHPIHNKHSCDYLAP